MAYSLQPVIEARLLSGFESQERCLQSVEDVAIAADDVVASSTGIGLSLLDRHFVGTRLNIVDLLRTYTLTFVSPAAPSSAFCCPWPTAGSSTGWSV